MNPPPLVSYQAPAHLPVTTTFTIEGYRIVRYLGVVRGIIVRAPTIPQGILGGLKAIIGGNIVLLDRDYFVRDVFRIDFRIH